MTDLELQKLFITIILSISTLSLIVPVILQSNRKLRNYLLLTINAVFLLNVIILDIFYLNGLDTETILFHSGKYEFALHTEPIGMIFLNLLALLWICAIMYSTKFLELNHIHNESRFLFFMNLCITMGVLIALSKNLITMFISYEVLTLSTIPLIVHQRGNKVFEALYIYLKILIITSLLLFLPATIIIYSKIEDTSFALGGFIASYFSEKESIILLLMFIFGIAKTAIYPLHYWLPQAMVASYPVSALLHAVVVVKAGLVCIYKLITYVFGIEYLHSIMGENNFLILIPIITIIYSSLKAIQYKKIKMILAYSTINQLSIALLGAFLLSKNGMVGALIHMVSHSFTKISLFYGFGIIYSVKKLYNIEHLIGLSRNFPKMSLLIFISGLSLIGVPPFAGFISKFYIIRAAIEQDNFLALITIIISSIFSVLYVIKIIFFIYRSPITDTKYTHTYNYEKNVPKSMMFSVMICTACIIGFPIIQQIIIQFLKFL